MSGLHDDQERLTEALSAYLDGALDGAERDALERHLATCDACRTELAGLRRVGAMLKALPEPDLPRSFTLPTSAPGPEPAGATRRAQRWSRAAQWAGGLAAALGAGLLVAGMVQPPVNNAASTSAPDLRHSSSAGAASIAPTPSASASSQVATNSPAGAGAEITPAPLPTSSATYGATQPATPSATPIERNTIGGGSPLVPAGATLLVGGGAALAAGTVSRRRKRRGARAR